MDTGEKRLRAFNDFEVITGLFKSYNEIAPNCRWPYVFGVNDHIKDDYVDWLTLEEPDLVPLEGSAMDLSQTSYFTEDGNYEVRPLRASCFAKEGGGQLASGYDLLAGIQVDFEITGHHSRSSYARIPSLREDDVRLYTPDGQERKESKFAYEGFDRPYGSGLPDTGETEVFTSLFGDGDGVIGDGNLDCLAGTYRVVLGYDSGWVGEEVEALLDETFVLGD